MIETIVKRDGRVVPFNAVKITDALFAAIKASGSDDYVAALRLTAQVVDLLENQGQTQAPGVEQIQDAAEQVLIENGFTEAAKRYILYRADRNRSREMNTRLMQIYEGLTFKDAKDNDIKRENANIDGDTAMGTMLKYGSEGAKQFNKMLVLNPKHSAAHDSGDIHIHDLDFLTLTTTCCQIDIDKLFAGGFSTGHGFLREPQSIASYSSLACIAIQSNQNDQHGGQSIPNFDYAMSGGVKKTYVRKYRENLAKALELLGNVENSEEKAKEILASIKEEKGLVPVLDDNNGYHEAEVAILEKMLPADVVGKVHAFTKDKAFKETDRETFQAMEAFIHNLNTMHSRAGAQIPFSSINYGTDTSSEGRMVMKNLLLAHEAGLGNGETPIFPIHIFKVKEGISYNEEDPNYDLFQLACRVSAKRLFPNFSFIDAPFNLQYYKPGNPHTEVAYMGCRTRVIANEYDKSREIVTSRGNLSFTSINLPRLGIEAKGDVNKFFNALDERVDLVIEQLLERFEIQAAKKVKNFPFLMGQGIWLDSEKLGPDDEIREVIKHGSLSVGFIGLAECLKALIGVHHGESAEAQELGLKIVQFIRNKTDLACRKYGLNFTCLGTPAEGLSGRFIKIDKAKYGKLEGITDREYYTNSFHVPVHFPITAQEKIKLEAPYHAFTNAGHISYVEVDGDPSKNLDAFISIIRAMKEAGIGYGSINHPIDRDPLCGYNGIIDNECPRCGRKEDEGDIGFERIRRITGYLVGTLDRFNNAKRAEVEDRVKHTGGNMETL